MWSDASNYIWASNYKQGDDVWNKLRSTWMGIRRGGMWGEVDRRSMKGGRGRRRAQQGEPRGVDVKPTV